ncbi:hypothetical protein M5K25_000468 [Dendrobium thyrsiflorum]|uniref:Uncharacterized protein n=1 Tax=Dendrobium thyrsiflorum TaxID=117978 RepID=A0ABD0W4Z9_DENTH
MATVLDSRSRAYKSSDKGRVNKRMEAINVLQKRSENETEQCSPPSPPLRLRTKTDQNHSPSASYSQGARLIAKVTISISRPPFLARSIHLAIRRRSDLLAISQGACLIAKQLSIIRFISFASVFILGLAFDFVVVYTDSHYDPIIGESQRSHTTRPITPKRKRIRSTKPGGRQMLIGHIEDLVSAAKSISLAISSSKASRKCLTIADAWEELSKFPEIFDDHDFYDFVVQYIQDRNQREAFMGLPNDRKVWFLRRRYHMSFTSLLSSGKM